MSKGTDTLAQLGGGVVGTLALLDAAHSGNLFGALAQRQKLLQDPEFRASLVGSPFASGEFFVGGRQQYPGFQSPGSVPVQLRGPGLSLNEPIPGPPAPTGPQQFVPNLPPLGRLSPEQLQQKIADITATLPPGSSLTPTYKVGPTGDITTALQSTPDLSGFLAPGGAGEGMGILGYHVNPRTGNVVYDFGRPPAQHLMAGETLEGNTLPPGTPILRKPATPSQMQQTQKTVAAGNAIDQLNALAAGPIGQRPIDVLPTAQSAGGYAPYLLGIPGAGQVQQFRLGAQSRSGGIEGQRAQAFQSIKGLRAQFARMTSEVGNLAEREQQIILDSIIPNENDTVESAQAKIALANQYFGPAIQAMQAGDLDTARALMRKVGGTGPQADFTTPPTATTTTLPPSAAPADQIERWRKTLGITQ